MHANRNELQFYVVDLMLSFIYNVPRERYDTKDCLFHVASAGKKLNCKEIEIFNLLDNLQNEN